MEKKLILSKKETLHVMSIFYDCELDVEIRISSPYVLTRLHTGEKELVFMVTMEFDEEDDVMYSLIVKSLNEIKMYEVI